jgi:hypothetical protein
MSTKPDVTTLVLELRATLDHIGDALINGAFDELIATESRLAGIVGGFGQVLGDGAPTISAPSELDGALDALRRCQRLGAVFTEMRTNEMRTAWPNTAAGSYDRAGRSQAGVVPPPTSLKTRA